MTNRNRLLSTWPNSILKKTEWRIYQLTFVIQFQTESGMSSNVFSGKMYQEYFINDVSGDNSHTTFWSLCKYSWSSHYQDNNLVFGYKLSFSASAYNGSFTSKFRMFRIYPYITDDISDIICTVYFVFRELNPEPVA